VDGLRFMKNIIINFHTVCRPLFYAEDLSIISPELEKIHVWDSTGKEWKVSKKSLKSLFKDVQKINPDKNE
jgi:hypothetical protein